MLWKHTAGGCLALLLLAQGAALANSITQMPAAGETIDSPEQPAKEAPPPWAELRSGDLQQPLLGGEYNRIMASLWTQLNDNWNLRSHHITTACDALGSDMAYLRGRVPRQIEDAYRQMAPFQTKALVETSPAPGQRQSTARRIVIPIDDTEAETLLELIRTGDSLTYDTYEQLLRHFVDLDLATYLDPAQDDAPLSRGEFLAYVETLHLKFQDPTGALGRYEQFLLEADRLIQDLLTMLREVRRSLALLETTKTLKATRSTSLATPSQPRLAQYRAPLLPLPTIPVADDATVTRQDFLLAMLGLVESFTVFPHRPAHCGGYLAESFVSPAEEMEREMWHLMHALDSLNLEILTLVRDRSR